ncbi:unnamed protein product [Allacma fusca]|uniref:Uncharacterized protein n=1 Tax=Allacma fusca TaxID=39272 RepID=A0A8J2P8V2_9HEXA|nr:unnamed protein product [Allacma fusca]
MGRYDSPLSIATLFLAATVVSVGLIFLFDAETERRHPNKVLAPAQLKPKEELLQEGKVHRLRVHFFLYMPPGIKCRFVFLLGPSPSMLLCSS